VFTDEEFAEQAQMVLEERLNLLEYALKHYEDGVLFFYFSSTDLQSHMFWWNSLDKHPHPVRYPSQAVEYHKHIRALYKKMDDVLGNILRRYGDNATIFVLSDHGFANLKGLFSLNTWLRDNGYIKPDYCTTSLKDVDWSKTRAYGLGLNGLYLNLKGRESDGIVEPGCEREELLQELIAKLETVRDVDGRRIIRKAYRADRFYVGSATELAPDLIVGYYRGYRCLSSSGEGKLSGPVLEDNKWAWSADHCFAPEEIPGVLFSNRPIAAKSPSLVDLAPTILAEFGLSRPSSMVGKNVFA
jgi:predicted AlkP superfamily phosphohydrolase/phosphomutase